MTKPTYDEMQVALVLLYNEIENRPEIVNKPVIRLIKSTLDRAVNADLDQAMSSPDEHSATDHTQEESRPMQRLKPKIARKPNNPNGLQVIAKGGI